MKALLTAFSLLLAMTANAQFPKYVPTLADQLEAIKQESARVLQENSGLRQQLARARANLKSCDSLLVLTMQDTDIALMEKDKRIRALQDEANGKLLAENQRTNNTVVAFNTLEAGLNDVSRQITDEALTSRPLGIGRKPALIRIRQYISKLLQQFK